MRETEIGRGVGESEKEIERRRRRRSMKVHGTLNHWGMKKVKGEGRSAAFNCILYFLFIVLHLYSPFLIAPTPEMDLL